MCPLLRAHAIWMLSGACNPAVCFIHVCPQSGHRDHLGAGAVRTLGCDAGFSLSGSVRRAPSEPQFRHHFGLFFARFPIFIPSHMCRAICSTRAKCRARSGAEWGPQSDGLHDSSDAVPDSRLQAPTLICGADGVWSDGADAVCILDLGLF